MIPALGVRLVASFVLNDAVLAVWKRDLTDKDKTLVLALRSTKPIENLNGAVAHHARNVKRWRDGQMVLRWVGAALL